MLVADLDLKFMLVSTDQRLATVRTGPMSFGPLSLSGRGVRDFQPVAPTEIVLRAATNRMFRFRAAEVSARFSSVYTALAGLRRIVRSSELWSPNVLVLWLFFFTSLERGLLPNLSRDVAVRSTFFFFAPTLL